MCFLLKHGEHFSDKLSNFIILELFYGNNCVFFFIYIQPLGSSELNQAVSGMVFKELRSKFQSADKQHWFAELLVVTFHGNLACYLVRFD